jgi:hypothetical protein
MSRQEARRRLQAADPNLKIVSGRRGTTSGGKSMDVVPRVLSPEEAEQWGLPEMIPRFPPEEILAIEALYSKKQLESLCVTHWLEPIGGKDKLIQKLIYVGAMDIEGNLIKAEATAGVAPFVGPKFDLGQLVMTAGVADRVATDAGFAAFALASLKRHANGDWGDLSEEDKKENEFSLDKYLRLFSAYEKHPMPKIWIITEADRSVTTTLFPEEY